MISYLSMIAVQPQNQRRRRKRDSPPANRILANSKANWIARRAGPASDVARPEDAVGWFSPETACGDTRLARCARTPPPAVGFRCSIKSHPDHRSVRPAQQKRPAPESLAARGTGLAILPVEEEDQVRQLSGLPPAFARLRRATADEIDQISFGSLAVIARESCRPMALRPRLSTGLPLSGHRPVLKRTATWGACVGSPGRF